MSGEVFEYFFDPEELEPFYSELPTSTPIRRRQTSDALIRPPQTPAVREAHPRTIRQSEASQPEPQGVDAKVRSALPTPTVAGLKSPGKGTVTAESTAETLPVSATVVEPTQHGNGRTRVRQLLSVHALGQYVFCPRSAILAAERGDEQDVNEPLPRLTYLPNFDRARIEELLKKKLGQVGFSLVYGSSTVCLMAAGVLSQNKTMFYPALLIFHGLHDVVP